MKNLLLLFFISCCTLATQKQTMYEESKKNLMNTYGLPMLNYTSATTSGTKALVCAVIVALKDKKGMSYLTAFIAFSGETALGVISARTNAETASSTTHKKIIAANIGAALINGALIIYNPEPLTILSCGINSAIQITTAVYKYFYQKNNTQKEQ